MLWISRRSPTNRITRCIALSRALFLGAKGSNHCFYHIVLCAAQNTQPFDKHSESMLKGTGIVRRHIVEKGEVERACSGGALLLAEHGSFADDAVMEKIVLGVPRKPADFIQAAVQAGHPRSLNSVSEDAVVANRDWPVTDLISRARIDFLTYWMKRAQELEHAEKTLHLSMPEYLQQVLRGKRILLMGEMLERLGFEDKCIRRMLRQENLEAHHARGSGHGYG